MRHTILTSLAISFVSTAVAAQTPGAATSPLPLPGTRDQAPAPASPAEEQPSGFVPVLRLGAAPAGSAKFEFDCTATGAYSCSSLEPVEADTSSTAFGADFLFHTSAKLRLGVATSVERSSYRVPGATEQKMGPRFALAPAIEGFFPLSRSVAVTLRGQLGATMLLLGEDHERIVKETANDCSDSDTHCNTELGPFFGATAALGVGLAIRAGATRLRLDVLNEGYATRYSKIAADDSFGTSTLTITMSGQRTWLMAGLEL